MFCKNYVIKIYGVVVSSKDRKIVWILSATLKGLINLRYKLIALFRIQWKYLNEQFR